MQDATIFLKGLSPDQKRLLIEKLKQKNTASFKHPFGGDIREQAGLEAAPLSFAQQRLWFLDQLYGPNSAYNIPFAWRLAGTLRLDLLKKSLECIVGRHNALRAEIIIEDGRPKQRFPFWPNVDLPVTDLGHLSGTGRQIEVRRIIDAEELNPFDLAAERLMRAKLLTLGPKDVILLLTFHHMVFDGWSLGVFLRELAIVYEALALQKSPTLPKLSIQYADFALWQQAQIGSKQFQSGLAFWQIALKEAPSLLELPLDHPYPRQRSFRGGRFTFTIATQWVTKIKRAAANQGATLFMALLAVYALLLCRYSSQDDIVIGTVVSGRNRPQLEPLIGFFINTLALRIRFTPSISFKQLLHNVKKIVFAAHSHQEVPFEKLVETLAPRRHLTYTPLFQASFVLQNMPLSPFSLPDLVVTSLETDRLTAKFDLNLIMQETSSGLGASFEYSSDLFTQETIGCMAQNFEHLLQSVITAPDASVFKPPLLIKHDTPSFAARAKGIKKEDGRFVSVCQRFEQQAVLRPEAPALIYGKQRLGYQALNRRANQLARYLKVMGVGPEVGVAILLERSFDLIISILAVLKAQGAYIPIDPNTPEKRLNYILKDSKAFVLITNGQRDSDISYEAVEKLDLSKDKAAIDHMDRGNLSLSVLDDSLAYIIYTSGSTGTPKGSLVTHGNLARLFTITQELFGFGPKDVFTLFHSCAFDFSVWEIWGALLYGGTLIIVPYLVSRSPEEFYGLLLEHKITVLNQTPSAFYQLIEMDRKAGGTSKLFLKWVIFGGEVLDARLLEPWWAKHGDRTPQLVNMYGITETTVHVTWHRLTVADLDRPGSLIGKPLLDLGLHILDGYMNRLPCGIKGEIYVEGAGICRGYLNRFDLTAASFIPNPFNTNPETGTRLYKTGDLGRYRPDGTVEYLGRSDRQVKIRGFRIELNEIEFVLCRYPDITRSVVAAHADALSNLQLVAYLVCEKIPETKALKAFLKQRLPDYMIPAVFITLDQIPLSASNKIDYKRLPEPKSLTVKGPYDPPQTPTEKILAQLIEDLLKQNPIGRQDDFFSIGGHSLLAVQAIFRIREKFKIHLPIRKLFEAPTIAGLALLIETVQALKQNRVTSTKMDEKAHDGWEEGEI